MISNDCIANEVASSSWEPSWGVPAAFIMNNDQLAGSHATVSLGSVLDAVAQRVHQQFASGVHDLPQLPSQDRPQALLGFAHGARQQLLRAAALLHDTRKLPPVSQLVRPQGVLDVAATHARVLVSAADELFRAHVELRQVRQPLFNVPDALDVLSTGTYSNLPAAILDLRGPKALNKQQQQRLVNQLNHLLHSQLLKAHLPHCLELVQVTGGYAVLRCNGLYEVQLSLFQQPYPPQVEEATQEAATAAAQTAEQQQGGWGQQQQEGTKQPTTQVGAAPAAAGQGTEQADTSTPAVTEQQQPSMRWQWTLTHAVLLPGAAFQPPLRQVQLEQLLRALRQRMWYAADAAAAEAAAAEAAKEGAPLASKGTAQADAAGATTPAASQQPSSSQGGTSRRSSCPSSSSQQQPSMSGMSGPGPTASGVSAVSGAAAAAAGRGLQLDQLKDNEVAIPLRIMHGILRDISTQILLHDARLAAEKLASQGSKWEGHLKLAQAEVLTPGIRLHYWQRVPVLLAQQPGSTTAIAPAAADGSKAVTGSSNGIRGISLPAVELGLDSDGLVQVLHLPPLRLPGSLQQAKLRLNTHTVDVEGLLLQAAAVICATQLHVLHTSVTQLLKQRGVQTYAEVQLRNSGLAATTTVSAGSTTASALAAAAADTPAAALPDVLAIALGGQGLVSVSLQPWSGRVIIRPGSTYGGEHNMEMGLLLQQHQEQLQQKQDTTLKQLQLRRNDQHAIQQCLEDIATAITDLSLDLWLKMQLNSFLAVARQLSLHHTQHILKGVVKLPQQLQFSPATATMDAQLGSSFSALEYRSGCGSQPTLKLAMPQLQLPAYMLLLVAGSWCGSSSSSFQGRSGGGAAAVPAAVAALGPLLCMCFPRVRDTGYAQDCLQLVLYDAQGLAGPVAKTLRLPVTCYAATAAAACTGAARFQGATDGAGAAFNQRKRKRDNDTAIEQLHGGPSKQLAGRNQAVGAEEQQQHEAHQQLQKQEQQQQQHVSGQGQHPQQLQDQQQQHLQQQQWLLQPQEYAAELTGAVQWCQARLTLERLLLELNALQVQYQQVLVKPSWLHSHAAQQQQQHWHGKAQQHQQQPAGQQQQWQQHRVWEQPAIRLLAVPGVQLLQRLQRKQGCMPASLGLEQVWLTAGSPHGHFTMWLQGSLYFQSEQAAGSQVAQTAAQAQAVSLQLSRYKYSLLTGQDVHAAMVQLQQVLQMQRFLNKLESMAPGDQQLQVVEVGRGLMPLDAVAAEAEVQAGVDADQVLPTCLQKGHAGVNGDLAHEQVLEVDGGKLPPAKRARQQSQQQHQQSDGHMHVDGPQDHSMPLGMAVNGLLLGEVGRRKAAGYPISNGNVEVLHNSSIAGSVTCTLVDPNAVSRSDSNSNSSSRLGLLFHWAGTGLVRLARYCCSTAILEAGAPLPILGAAAAGPGSLQQQLAAMQQHSQQQPQQVQQRPCLQFLVQWQPRFVFTAHGNGSAQQPSSIRSGIVRSSSPIVVDARPSTNSRGNSSSNSSLSSRLQRPGSTAVTHLDVLDMLCSFRCCAPSVPVELLNELADMAHSGCEDLLLDTLAIVGWPLAAAAVSTAAAAAVSRTGVIGSFSRPASAFCSRMVSGINHVRYSISLPALFEALELDLLFTCRGRVKLVVHSLPSRGNLLQQQQQGVEIGTGQSAAKAVAAVVAANVTAVMAGFQQHMAQRHRKVILLPVLRSGQWVPQNQQQQAQAVQTQQGLAGFWLQTQHLTLVLQELIRCCQQKACSQQANTAAAANNGTIAGNPGQTAVKFEAPQPVLEQQQQQAMPQPIQPALMAAAAGGTPAVHVQPPGSQASVKIEQLQQQSQQQSQQPQQQHVLPSRPMTPNYQMLQQQMQQQPTTANGPLKMGF